MTTDADTEIDAVEIHVSRRQIVLALLVVGLLVLGGISFLVPHFAVSQPGYDLTVRCLPDLHFAGIPRTVPTASSLATADSVTPSPGRYREIPTGPCDLPAGFSMQSGHTAATACITTSAVHIAPGDAAHVNCQPTNTVPTRDLLGVCLAQNPAFLEGQGNSSVNDVCTLWIEAATYRA